jgi:hypothetical protein
LALLLINLNIKISQEIVNQALEWLLETDYL